MTKTTDSDPTSASAMEMVLITGLSGSGKSVALAALEDAGYFCVDNFPGQLFNNLVDTLVASRHMRVALTMDARSGEDMSDFPAHVESLRERGIHYKLIYLDTKDEALIRRFSETRRKHPLSDGHQTLGESIALDRVLLQSAAALANRIDTSDLSPKALRTWIREFIAVPRNEFTLMFESFGFKFGIPLDADLVFDVRSLPNPHYDPALRRLSGRDPEVIAFLDDIPEAQCLLEDIRNFVAKWLPSYMSDNRSYLTVAIGCTGGRHRSVYFVEALEKSFRDTAQVLTRHRGLA